LLYFVINPKAGNGKAVKVWYRLEAILGARNIRYNKITTAQAGETAEWCRRLVEKQLASPEIALISTVVIVGGDGTLNEAVQGLMSAAKGQPLNDAIRLSFIPAGSGNDFVRGHGIPFDPEDALKHLLQAVHADRRAPVDVLEVNGRFAVSSIGVGLDGEVAYTANHAPYKRWMNRLGLGNAAYILSLLRVLMFYKPFDAELTVDGVTVSLRRVWLAAFSNIPQYGGGMHINPGADPADAIADICVVSGMSRAGLLAAFPKVYSGRHTGHPHVHFFRGSVIHLTPHRPSRMHADGEDAGLSPAAIRVIRHALNVVK
jgi:diacylglycerol kinase (ATP)